MYFMKKFFAIIGDSLIIGYLLIPNLLFSYLFYNHRGLNYYIMPFILFYALNKSGLFLLRGLGIINNFFKTVKLGLLSAILGTILMIINTASFDNYLIYDGCAILMGLGLSCYPATYLTIRDQLTIKQKWPLNNSLLLALPLAFLFIVTLKIFIRNYYSSLIWGFLIYLIIIFIFLYKLSIPYEKNNKKIFIPHTDEPSNVIFFILVFLLAISTKFVIESPHTLLIFIIITVIISIIFFLHFYKDKPYYSLLTLWFGGIRSCLIVYTIINYTVIGQYSKANLAYILFVFSILLAISILKIFKLKINVQKCIIMIIFISILLLFKQTYLIGLCGITIFGTMGSVKNRKYYTNDSQIIKNEKRPLRYRYLNMGSIIMQAIVIIILVIVSAICNNNKFIVLNDYAFHNIGYFLYKTLNIAIIINWLVIILSGLGLLKFEAKYEK